MRSAVVSLPAPMWHRLTVKAHVAFVVAAQDAAPHTPDSIEAAATLPATAPIYDLREINQAAGHHPRVM
jgi:hypothetical protein